MTITLGALIARMLTEYPSIRGTHRSVLEHLQTLPIARVKAPGTSKNYIDHCRMRRETVAPSTVLNDVVFIRGVLSYAKPGWGMADITDAPLREAWPVLKKQGLIGQSKRRFRRPSEDEIQQRRAWFRDQYHGSVPIVAIDEFQIESSRRISETVRLQWGDLNRDKKMILVRDMKHPTRKTGNHRWVALPDRALEIILEQPRLTTDSEERIFKCRKGTVQALFKRAHEALGIDDLHLHDSRRECATRLLERGYPPHYIMLVTGHEEVRMVTGPYNALTAEDFHKFRGAQC